MIRVSEPLVGTRELEYLTKVVVSNQFTAGPFVAQFEQQIADAHECEHGIATCNGTAALHLALKALGLHEGQEVLVPALTFIATANAVTYCGATPVFVDVNPQTWNIATQTLWRAITPRTVGIIPVHLYGKPCDMDGIHTLAALQGLWVVEDAAEALGAYYHARNWGRTVPVGHQSTAAVFSFYGNKLITTGEGGMVVCHDTELAKRMRHLRGQAYGGKSYWHDAVGYNYRMTELQAALGCAQLEHLSMHLALRGRNRYWYDEYLGDQEWCHFQDRATADGVVWWMNGVLLDNVDEAGRDEIMARMALKGIETRPFFYPLHTLPPYCGHNRQPLPVAEDISRRGLCLPSGGKLVRDDIQFIAQSLVESYQWQQSLNRV